MKLRKAIVVTVLMSGLMFALHACLYELNNVLFGVLTATVTFYGFLRGAADFCLWLCKPDPDACFIKRGHALKKPEKPVQPQKKSEKAVAAAHDLAKEEEAQSNV